MTCLPQLTRIPLTLLALAPIPAIAQLRAIQRTVPFGNTAGNGACYDDARHLVVALTSRGTREWDGKGLVSSAGDSSGTSVLCKFPGQPGALLAFGINGTRRYQAGQWSTLSPATEPPRDFNPTYPTYSMAYDEARDRAVLVCHGVFRIPTCWEFDGSNWANTFSSPTAALLTYDSHRQRIVGVSLTTHTEWNGAAWTTVGSAPGTFAVMALCYDRDRRRVVIFGGALGAETYEFDGQAWQQRAPATRPPARASATLVYDQVRGVSVLFGGSNAQNQAFEDVWTWNGIDWTAQSDDVRTPGPRNEAMMAAAGDGCILFGGRTILGGFTDATHRFDGQRWRDISTFPAPTPRAAAAMTALAGGNALLFGGLDAQGTYLADAQRHDGGRWLPVFAAGGIPGRVNHAMATDAFDDARPYLFGGASATTKFGDLWTLDNATQAVATWRQLSALPSPGARRDLHAMTFDDGRRRLVLFGGRDGNSNFLDDTWEYEPLRDRWTEVRPARRPPPLVNHALVYDAARARIVLIGGYSTTYSNAIWEYDGQTWEQGASETTWSVGVQNVAAAYDLTTRRIVTFGGQTNAATAVDATYEFMAHVDTSALSPTNALPLAIVTRPKLGAFPAPLRVQFAAPSGLALLMLQVGATPRPLAFLAPPTTCGTEALYVGFTFTIVGNDITIPMPGALANLDLTVQGAAYQLASNCWNLTHPWLARVRT